MAVRGLPLGQKRNAVMIGGAGALVLRLILTGLAAALFQIPLLQAVGGLVLAWITYRLLLPGGEASPSHHAIEPSFGAALRTIIIADLTMSLDNVLAVAAAAGHNIALLVIGLALSMAIILAGGALVAMLLARLGWLVYLGGVVLLIVAGELLAADPLLAGLTGAPEWASWAYTIGLAGLVGAALLVKRAAPPEKQDEPKSDILHV